MNEALNDALHDALNQKALRTPTRTPPGSARPDARRSGAERTDRSRRALARAAAIVLSGSAACMGPGSNGPELDARARAAARAARAEILREAIAEDHETLQRIVSAERGEQATPIYAEPEVEAIARRLGPHEEELADLLSEATPDADAPWMPR